VFRIDRLLQILILGFVLVALAGLPTPAAANPPPPALSDKCSDAQKRTDQAELSQGEIAQRNFDYQGAAAKFADVMKSCDSTLSGKAYKEFDDVNRLMEKTWWRWGNRIPGLHWWYERPEEREWLAWNLPKKFWSSRWTVIHFGFAWLIAFVAAVWIVGPLLKYAVTLGKTLAGFPLRLRRRLLEKTESTQKFRWVGRVFQWFPYASRRWVLPFLGEAQLVMLDKLDDTYEPDLFRRQLIAAMGDIRYLVDQAGAGWVAGPSSLLAVPSGVASDLLAKFPDIKGANLGPILAGLLSFFTYFGWRVECGETFLGNSKTIDSFATLRWGWFVRQSWRIQTPAMSKTDLAGAARDLALLILSARYTNRPAKNKRTEFEDADHFVYFMQGATAIQRYDAAAAQPQPDRATTTKCLSSAQDGFRRCVNLYPDHLLSQFYLAFTLVLLNQDLVVGDLARRIDDLSDEPCYVESSNLDRAIALFRQVAESGEAEISHFARYNWAKALVKRERPATAAVSADLDQAHQVLGTLLEQTNSRLGGLEERERTALRIQTQGLRDYIAIRQATPDCRITESFISTPDLREHLGNLQAIPVKAERNRREGRLSGREVFDLTSDFRSAVGYLYYELARCSRDVPGVASVCLSEGKKSIAAALELKPNWTPAQINNLRLTIEGMRREKRTCDSSTASTKEKARAREDLVRLRAEAKGLLTAIQGDDKASEPMSAALASDVIC